MNLKDSVEDLCAMLFQGRTDEAWDKYYAEDVVRRTGSDPPRVGKARNQDHDKDFVNCVTAWKAAEIKAMAVDLDHAVTMIEWFLEFSHKTFGDMRQNVVFVQRWRDGRIYDESIYVMHIKD